MIAEAETMSIEEFAAGADRLVPRLAALGRGIRVTVGGHEVVVLDPAEYDRLVGLAEEAEVAASIQEGRAAYRRSEGQLASEFFDELFAEHGFKQPKAGVARGTR